MDGCKHGAKIVLIQTTTISEGRQLLEQDTDVYLLVGLVLKLNVGKTGQVFLTLVKCKYYTEVFHRSNECAKVL